MPVTINISSTRALTVTGRLVAGESAAIAVTGGTPAALYLVDEKRAVVAACQQFEGGAGTINLATVPIGRIFSTVPAGRAVSLACLVEGESGGIIGYGFIPVVSAPMPDDLVDVDVDTYIRASDIRALFADIPTEYANQRSLSEALSQVVTVLKTLGLSALIAFSVLATEWQDVPANTVIGDGLTLTNGTISAAGGGGLSTNDVEAIVATATNGMVRKTGDVMTGPLIFNDGTVADPQSAFPVTVSGSADGGGTGGLRWNAGGGFNGHFAPVAGSFWEFYFRNRWFRLPFEKGGITNTAPAEIAVMKDLEDAGLTNALGTAAYKDANEFATAADEALVYQLIMGSNVVAEVTNYNSRVRAPSFRLLQLDPDTKEYFTVWAETNGLSRTLNEAKAHTDAATNALARAKADRAWSHHTSGLGAEAPAGVTWISTPETVVAGGYEYAKQVTTHGEVWVLSSNGLGIGADTNSFFAVKSGDGETLFSIEKTDSVLVGVDADSISVSGGVVTIPVGVVSQDPPVCYAADNLVNAQWTDLTQTPLPAWVSSATCTGGPGAWVWTIETTAPSAFFQFRVLQPGSTVIRNNAQTDLSQGILVNGTRFYPHINNGTLTWTTTP